MSTESLLADLISRWERARDQGQQPTAEELCRDHPELLGDLRRQLAALESMERRLESSALETVTVTAEPDAMPGESKPPPLKAAPDDLPEMVGRYRIEEEIARGGMGRIVRVRDDDFERSLALKVLLTPEPIIEERFLREARLTGRLQHPGIPPVHELGRLPDGRPYPQPARAHEWGAQPGAVARRQAALFGEQ